MYKNFYHELRDKIIKILYKISKVILFNFNFFY